MKETVISAQKAGKLIQQAEKQKRLQQKNNRLNTILIKQDISRSSEETDDNNFDEEQFNIYKTQKRILSKMQKIQKIQNILLEQKLVKQNQTNSIVVQYFSYKITIQQCEQQFKQLYADLKVLLLEADTQIIQFIVYQDDKNIIIMFTTDRDAYQLLNQNYYDIKKLQNINFKNVLTSAINSNQQFYINGYFD